MNYGFVKVATATQYTKIADCKYNAIKTLEIIKEASQKDVSLLLFPELNITGYSCADLFFEDRLLKESKIALKMILEDTKDLNMTIIVGMPIEHLGRLYNCGICFYKGEILGIVPKKNLPNHNEFYEKRYFDSYLGNKSIKLYDTYIANYEIDFGYILFDVKNIPYFKFAIEICEDLWSIIPPSSIYSLNGANIICNLSASDELTYKDDFRINYIKTYSQQIMSAYMYTSAGDGESTTDVVYSGHNFIYENGELLAHSEPFEYKVCYADIDLQKINSNKRKSSTYKTYNTDFIKTISYEMDKPKFKLTRKYHKMPYFTNNAPKYLEDTLNIQAQGLKTRLKHINTTKAILGISGGLDSTLALLAVIRTFDLLKYDRKGIIAVAMPCFGTTNRTYNNAKELCEKLGVTLLEINIEKSVKMHFEDISHDINIKDVVYENAQARERTKILMNLANKYKTLVIGTGDLSELALGFATYNGDHMSMYGLNASLPKTLIRLLVEHIANTNTNIKNVLIDILNTPISPELLPPNENEITQFTENIVGPYILHDFFLYHFVKNNFTPQKIHFLAFSVFKDKFSSSEIAKYLQIFYRRFYSGQFKRSAMPDGVKVIDFSLSPRADFRMSSDVSAKPSIDALNHLL